MVTRRDVARRAGTSEAVVSYVVNNGPRNVAPQTRERVLAAIRDLGYRANAAARSLRTSQSMTLGLVLPDASNAFYGRVAREIEGVTFRHGYALLVGNSMDSEERELMYINALLERQVDGLIIIPSGPTAPWLEQITASQVRSVILDRDVAVPTGTRVLIDNEAGAANAVWHLLRHGRSRIACIAGPEWNFATQNRVQGWRRALGRADIDPSDRWLRFGSYRREDGYRQAQDLFSSVKIDGLFVTSDEQAQGVLRAAHELGVTVPADVAIVSFDGLPEAAFSVPSLTSVEQPVSALVSSAVERVTSHYLPEDTERIVLATRLIVRESCGCTPEKTIE
jgi:LacI family transcriptional regulator